MNLRVATPDDSDVIATLLGLLDYSMSRSELGEKLAGALRERNTEVVVACDESGKVLGFVDVRYIPQLGLAGDFARISYLCVDPAHRSTGIGALLENYVEESARKRNCDRIEVHCHSRRKDAHRFYLKQGYDKSPEYLIKKL
ncbi:MAG: GNAT family N-acetyltransferase [Verrucomicrobiota bacterium]